MTKESEIDLELYLKDLEANGFDVQKVETYLENIISSNASKQPPEAL